MQRGYIGTFRSQVCLPSNILTKVVSQWLNRRTLATQANELPTSTIKIKSGMILSRAPLIMPDLTPLEKSYYNYQSELHQRMALTFPSNFYFPKGSLAESEFRAAQPKLNPKDKFVVLNRDQRHKQEIIIPERVVERETEESARIYAKIIPNSRITEADEENDVKSLERKLDRTLYFVTKTKSGKWEFPSSDLASDEALHDCSQRVLEEVAGVNIHTFLISKAPALVETVGDNTKVFYLKSRIFNGRVQPSPDSDVEDYAWLTKDELMNYVEPQYWEIVRNALSRN
ncbi:mitochondrial 54S ribosomal protein mL46 [Lipomyces oligophaga]|uniref:mitochondrial 54S ribosomal protein mL46 n=1 Tax=Lipomyces oligophaga TaxID=45792 RepID=UPI0034CFCE1C